MLFGWFTRYDIHSLEAHYRSSNALASLEEARKKVSICVIDDELFYQLPILQDHGFNIVQIGDPSSLAHIEKYDVIACDLRGVGEKFSGKLQGAAIIQEIKRARPEKYVIAYSGSFDRSNMARVADDYADRKISKSADVEKWVSVLDQAVQVITNPVEKWTRVRVALVERKLSATTISRLEEAYCRAILKQKKSIFIKYVTRIELVDDIRPIIQGLISSAIWTAIS